VLSSGYPPADPRTTEERLLSILWIILIVLLVLAVLGYFGRGRW
jgi:flagellar basal body-associated protein FliL